MKLPACIVLLAGLLISCLVTGELWRARERARMDEVQQLAQDRADVIHGQILRSMEVLHGMAALFEADRAVSRGEFQAFVSGSLARQPELQALAWNPRVNSAERISWEQRAQAEGFPGFRFTQENPAGGMESAGPRDVY